LLIFVYTYAKSQFQGAEGETGEEQGRQKPRARRLSSSIEHGVLELYIKSCSLREIARAGV